MGVWIEINMDAEDALKEAVTPCVGVWIEINYSLSDIAAATSLPAWECGLKYLFGLADTLTFCHSLRGSVD